MTARNRFNRLPSIVAILGLLAGILAAGVAARATIRADRDELGTWSSSSSLSMAETHDTRNVGEHAAESSQELPNSQWVAQQESPFQPPFRGRGSRRRSVRSDYLNWELAPGFEKDVFTFARVRYDSRGSGRRGRSWDNDYPDCDWNFSVRLHELTSVQVDPNGVVVRLTDDALFNYPFLYMSNVGNMALSDEEVAGLRRYLLNGGFLMADDFWAPAAWRHVRSEMKRVFPNREPVELDEHHEIFHMVYELEGTPQVPSIFAWQQGHTFEYWHGDPEGDEGPHFWGYLDDSGRLMALMCHNNDIGDGWEREGENVEYFHKYSERVSYPLGINIVTYALTH